MRFEAAAGLGRSGGLAPTRLAADGLLFRTARADGASESRNRMCRRWGRRLRGASCTPGLVADSLGRGGGSGRAGRSGCLPWRVTYSHRSDRGVRYRV